MKKNAVRAKNESNYKEILKVADTVSSINELVEKTGISYTNVKEAFKQHPGEYEKMKQKFAKARKQVDEVIVEVEVITEPIEKNDMTKRYVIDASISQTENLRDRIEELIKNPNAKIILTSITIKELISLEQFRDLAGSDAKYILGVAAENPDKFESVLIDEDYDKADNAIIAYCVQNKDNNLVLLTSDREMTLVARMYGVNVEYIKHNTLSFNFRKSVTNDSVKTKETNCNNLKTLKEAFVTKGKLYITCGQKWDKFIAVYSDGVYTDSGIKELKIGDEVFIGKNHITFGYSTFSNFLVFSLKPVNNAFLKFSDRVYDYEVIKFDDNRYTSFMKDFLK